MPMLIWVAGLSGYMHKGPLPTEWDGEPLRHDPAELERRLEQQRRDTFGRRRYEEIQALEAAAKEAERKASELRREQDRLAAVAATQEALRVAREARENAHLEWQDEFSLLQLRHAVDSFNAAHNAASRVAAAHLIELAALSARNRFNDDEEAVALLLLH